MIRARDLASRVFYDIASSIALMGTATDNVGKKMLTTGAALTAVGGVMTGIGVAGAVAITSMVKGAVEFENAIGLVKTQTDAAGGSMEELKAIVRAVARDIPIPLEQLDEGLYDIFSSIDTNLKGAEQILRTTAKAGVAGQVELRDAMRPTLAIMNAWKLEAGEVNRVHDVMFQLVRKGVGTYDEFAKTIGLAIQPAVSAGQSVETLAGMLAFLTRNGLSASRAATSAGRALDSLARPKVIANLEKMGVIVKDASGNMRPLNEIVGQVAQKFAGMTGPEKAAKLKEIFAGEGWNIQARRFWGLAIDNFGELDQRIQEMGDSTGALEEAFATMANTSGAQLQLLSNNWQIAKDMMGEVFLPALNKVVQGLIELLWWFQDLSPATRKFLAILMGVSTAFFLIVGPITLVVGLITMLAGAAKLAGTSLLFITGVIGGVSAAVVLVIAGIALMIKHWDKIKPVVDRAREAIERLVNWIWSKAKPLITDFVETAKPLWEDLARVVRLAWELIQTVIRETVEDIQELWDRWSSNFRGAWDRYWPVLSRTLKAVWEEIVQVIQGVLRVIEGILNVFIGVLTGDWERAWNGMRDILGGVWDTIKNVIQGAVDAITGIFELGIQAWMSAVEDAMGLVKRSIVTVWEVLPEDIQKQFPKVDDAIRQWGEEGKVPAKEAAEKVVEEVVKPWEKVPIATRDAVVAANDNMVRAMQVQAENAGVGSSHTVEQAQTPWQRFGNFMYNLFSFEIPRHLGSFLRWGMETFIPGMGSLRTETEANFSGLGSFLMTWSQVVSSVFSGNMNTMPQSVRSVFERVHNAIREWATPIVGVVGMIGSTVLALMTSRFDLIPGPVRNAFSQVWNAIKERAPGIISTVANFSNNVVAIMTGNFNQLSPNVRSAMGRVWDAFWQGTERIRSFAYGAFSTIVGLITGRFDLIPQAVRNAFSNAWNAVVDWGNRIVGAIRRFAEDSWAAFRSGFFGSPSSKIEYAIWRMRDNSLAAIDDLRKGVKALEGLGPDLGATALRFRGTDGAASPAMTRDWALRFAGGMTRSAINIAEGALQINIQGNADPDTVRQIEAKLAEFRAELVRQLTTRLR